MPNYPIFDCHTAPIPMPGSWYDYGNFTAEEIKPCNVTTCSYYTNGKCARSKGRCKAVEKEAKHNAE